MKTRKIMLTILCMVAFVTGAVAYNSVRMNGTLWCNTLPLTTPCNPLYSQSPSGVVMNCTTDVNSTVCTIHLRVIMNM